MFFQQKTAGARTPPASLPPPPAVTRLSSRCPRTVRVSHAAWGPVARPPPEGGGGTFLRASALTAAHLSVSPSSHVPHGSRCAAFTWVLCMRTPGRRNHFAYCSSHAHEGNAVLLLGSSAHSLGCVRVGVELVRMTSSQTLSLRSLRSIQNPEFLKSNGNLFCKNCPIPLLDWLQ